MSRPTRFATDDALSCLPFTPLTPSPSPLHLQSTTMTPPDPSSASPFALANTHFERAPSSTSHTDGTIAPFLAIVPTPSAFPSALLGRSTESYIPTPNSQGHIVTGERKKKSHAKRQPAGHIPRPRNAFILFRCDFVAQKKVPASVEHDHRNISRIAGKIWTEMNEQQREPWVKMAEQEKEVHRRKYPGYRYTPTGTSSAGVVKEKKAATTTNKMGSAAYATQPWDPSITSTNCSPMASTVPSTPDTFCIPSPQLQGQRRSSSCPPPTSLLQPSALDCSLNLPMTQDDLPRKPSRMLYQSGYSGAPSSYTSLDYSALESSGWGLNLLDPLSHHGSYPAAVDAARAPFGREHSFYHDQHFSVHPGVHPSFRPYTAPLEAANIFSDPWHACDKKDGPQDTLGYDLAARPPYNGRLGSSFSSVDPLHPALTDFSSFKSVQLGHGIASNVQELVTTGGSETTHGFGTAAGTCTLESQFGDLSATAASGSMTGEGGSWASDFEKFKFYDPHA